MIVVAGEALIDLILHPDGRLEAAAGGGPFNTARTLGRLGQAVAFLGRISSDRFGEMLRDRLIADGVDVGAAVATTDPTTLAVAELDARGAATYRFYVTGTSAPGLEQAALDDWPMINEPTLDAVHVGTLGLVLEPLAATVEALVGRAPADAVVMIDSNARPSATPHPAAWIARIERLLARADVVKASIDDLRSLRPEFEPEAAARELLAYGPRVVLLTDGGHPVHIVTPRGRMALVPPDIEVVDTVGAGDAFGGGFLAAWLGSGRGRSDLGDDDALGAAVTSAMRVAALTCMRVGAEPPTAAELAAWSATR